MGQTTTPCSIQAKKSHVVIKNRNYIVSNTIFADEVIFFLLISVKSNLSTIVTNFAFSHTLLHLVTFKL